MHIIAESLRERCCVRYRCRWISSRGEFTRSGVDARAKLRLGEAASVIGSNGFGITPTAPNDETFSVKAATCEVARPGLDLDRGEPRNDSLDQFSTDWRMI